MVSRPTRSTVKIKVGLTKAGEARHEVRHWKDLKVAHMGPDSEEASRPMRGRKPNPPPPPFETRPKSAKSEADINNAEVNKDLAPSTNKDAAKQTTSAPVENSKTGGRPARTTRNPNPVYVDGVTGPPPWPGFPPLSSTKPWSASANDLASINNSINFRHHQSGG